MLTKNKVYFLALVLVAIALLSHQSYNLTMMGLTTFILAYLSKGMRRCSK